MIPHRSAALTMLVVVAALSQAVGCASRSTQVGTEQMGASEARGQRAEQVVEPTVKEVPLDVARAVPALPLPPAEPETAYLLDVFFDFDQSALRIDGVAAVETNAHSITKDQRVNQIVLEGRGDEVGTSAYNMVLAERRARAVKRYLEDLGIPGMINVVSFGKDRPLCLEHNPDCWQKNRSVRFTVK
ncbi:MAG: OmpA family protein [Nitrospiraceae bacterium]